MKLTLVALLLAVTTAGLAGGCADPRGHGAALCLACQRPTVPSGQPCVDANGPVIDDLALRRALQNAARKLMDGKKATPTTELAEQLARKQCKITPPPARGKAMTPAQAYARCKSAVIVVAGLSKCTKCTKWHAGGASGVLIDPTGVFVTNYHVLANTKYKALVTMTADGQVHPVTEVLAASAADDLAIVRLDAGDKRLAALPVAAGAPIGTPVTVISHPKSRHYTLTAGIISRYQKTRRAGKTVGMMTITADFAQGSSGAPILDDRGSVIGLVSSTSSAYYPAKDGKKERLQMVFKQCVPGASILKLISGK